MKKTLILAPLLAPLLAALTLSSFDVQPAAAQSSAANTFDACVFGWADREIDDGPNTLAVHGPLNTRHNFAFNRYMDWFKVDDKTLAAVTHARTIILGQNTGDTTWTLASLAACPVPDAALFRLEAQGSLDGNPSAAETATKAIKMNLSTPLDEPPSVSVLRAKPLVVEVQAVSGDSLEVHEVALERTSTGWKASDATLVLAGPKDGLAPTSGGLKGWLTGMNSALRTLLGRK